MTIPASQVMELRNATGAGMMDCKRALEEVNGDLEQAKDYLRKKGIAVAAKKSSRETTEGGIGIAFSDDHGRAAMVHLASETDFVARNEKFQELLDGLTAQVLAQGDADLPAQQMADGSGTVHEVINQAIATLGENLQLLDAVRVEAGEHGRLGGYVHSNNKIGVLVLLRAEGEAPAEPVVNLAKDIAMHVAASQVHAVREEEIDAAVIAKEREIYSAQAEESGKPPPIVEKMVEGRMKKFVKEVTLLAQPFVKDPDKTVEQVVAAAAGDVGTGLQVEKFIKYQF